MARTRASKRQRTTEAPDGEARARQRQHRPFRLAEEEEDDDDEDLERRAADDDI